MRRLLTLGAVCALGLAAAGVWLALRRPEPRGSPPPATVPASLPITRPSTVPASQEVLRTWTEVLREQLPELEGTEELKRAGGLSEALGVELDGGVYLDARGDMWVTHPRGQSAEDAVAAARREQVHVLREKVEFVVWGRASDGGQSPRVVVRTAGGKFRWASGAELPRIDYRFEWAVALPDGRVVAPTEAGVALITDREERHTELAGPKGGAFGETGVVVMVAGEEVLAFRPWDNGNRGSSEVLRLVGDDWERLGEEKFPPRLVHVFGMTDGSMLALATGEDATLVIEALKPLKPVPIDEARVEGLVEKLNSEAPRERLEAQQELARYGASAWGVLERLRDMQTAEAQRTIDRLLGARVTPTLGVFSILPGPVQVLRRTPDGMLALMCLGGVGYLELGKEQTRSPALLVARPGRRVELVHPVVMEGRSPLELEVQLKYDELIVRDRLAGPMRFMSNHLAPLLRPEHRGSQTWIGADRRGRWVFQNPASKRFLVLDPWHADIKPRLPAWPMQIIDGETGWDDDDNAVIRKGGAWRLGESGWQTLNEKRTPMRTSAFDAPPPATRPGVIAALPDGTDVTATADEIVIGGQAVKLAAENVGEDTPRVIVAGGRLFVFWRPGRVARLSRGADGKWSVDGSFTQDIPRGEIRRIWLDPIGRICIAHDTDRLVILFPQGRIPPEIGNLITRPR
jgi:hypothetical protein